jgi:pantothenate kinase
VENDIVILPTHRIVVLEGMYVQLTVPPWKEATELLDERWFIEVERDIARGRIIDRHILAGIVNNEGEAARRFDENDWPNYEYLLKHSNVDTAHRIIHSIQDENIIEN